jgi:hypothetical protein
MTIQILRSDAYIHAFKLHSLTSDTLTVRWDLYTSSQ